MLSLWLKEVPSTVRQRRREATVSLCDNVKLAKAKDERAVAEQNTVAAFSMGKKVE